MVYKRGASAEDHQAVFLADFQFPGFWLPACAGLRGNAMVQRSIVQSKAITGNAVGPNLIDVEVGKRIKRRRLQLRVSQTALGAAIGVSFQQVQKYERGANRVSASTLYELAHILDVQMDFFFDGLAQRLNMSNRELVAKAVQREDFVATDEGQRLVDAFLLVPKKMRPRLISLLATFATGSTVD